MKKIRYFITFLSNKYVKNIFLIVFGFMLIYPVLLIGVQGDYNRLFTLTYLRGHGVTFIPLIASLIGIVFVFIGVFRLFNKEN